MHDAFVDKLAARVGALKVGPASDWKTALRKQVMAARAVMLRHPWARRVFEERGTGGISNT